MRSCCIEYWPSGPAIQHSRYFGFALMGKCIIAVPYPLRMLLRREGEQVEIEDSSSLSLPPCEHRAM
jgi:hypothetical protein